jgi:DNA-binding CsgD family transcriptional regulator
VIYKKKQNSWVQHKVFTLNESCRLIEEDNDGNIWFTSGYTGIYKIRLNNNADSIISMHLYGNKEGLPVSTYFGVFKVKDEVVFGTQKGVYSYNKSTNQIEPNKLLNTFFKDLHIRKLIEDKKGNIWYIASTSTGYLKLTSDGTYMQVKTPFQKIDDKQLPGFENISFIDDDNVMMGTKYGIINFNQIYKKDYYIPFLTILDKVVITTEPDSVIYQNVVQPMSDAVSNEKALKIPYKQNALRFSFSATFFENTADIVYKYKLDGFDDDWSNWVKKNEKEYTNIPEGNYTFRVKSKNIYGYESSEANIKITILPPWYRTTLAYICYALLCILLFWFIIFIKNLQFKKEKIVLEKDKLKAIRLKMTEHMQEKLQDELSNKNKELASTTMNLVQKNEIIIKIRDKLTSIVETLPEKEQKKLKSLEKLIDEEINDDSYWEQFEHHFNQIHDDFIKRFKMDHTSLTHKDLKMCAYLRMNLSNKEIATLLNITLRGVEASRLRLRKKLDLDKDILLTEYILRY